MRRNVSVSLTEVSFANLEINSDFLGGITNTFLKEGAEFLEGASRMF